MRGALCDCHSLGAFVGVVEKFAAVRKKVDAPDAACYLHVNAVPNTIDLTLRVDTRRVSPDDLVNCLRGIEEVVVNAAVSSRLA